MVSWQKWVLTAVFVGAAVAAAWFFLGDQYSSVEESTPEVDIELEEEESQ